MARAAHPAPAMPLPRPCRSWVHGALFSAMIASTDALAAAAILKQGGREGGKAGGRASPTSRARAEDALRGLRCGLGGKLRAGCRRAVGVLPPRCTALQGRAVAHLAWLWAAPQRQQHSAGAAHATPRQMPRSSAHPQGG